jgi:N-acetylglucosamine malate deacetylase 1
VSQEPSVSSSKIIADYLRLLKTPLAVPEFSASPLSTALPSRDISRPCVLLLSPHPDDECLTGALPLRLMREQGWQTVNIAVTLGSDSARRKERKNELAKACATLGFACILPEEEGFSDINVHARSADPTAWNNKVKQIEKIIAHIQPQAILMPHAEDGHATHSGTHFLGMNALANMPQNFTCAIVLTEYWHPLPAPNAIVGIGENDASTLMSALACHEGEVARNAYDKRFPSFLIDTVRRGETLNGNGKIAPAMDFAQMVQLGVWVRGRFVPSALNRFIGAEDPINALFT